MPSTYTLNNGIELIATGEQSGTWGDTTNVNLGLIDTALDGQVTITLPAAGSSGSPNALAISDGSASDGRNRLIIFTDGGDLGATAFVQLTPNDAEKIVYIRNNLSGGRAITLFQGTYNASNDYEVPAGTTAVVFFNGGGAGAVAANVFNNAFFDSLRLGGVSVTAILDEDNMASDSATALATQQSIKAYVDAQVGANNELSEVLANGNTSGGNDIQMTTTDEVQFRDTALKISSSVDGQLDIAADVELEIVAPTLDINASTAVTIDTTTMTMTGSVNVVGDLDVDNLNINGNTIISTNTDGNIALTPNGTGEVDISKVDIDGGTIDGTVIGGSTPAAISGTTGQFGTSLNVDGTVTADGLTVDGVIDVTSTTSLSTNLQNTGGSALLPTYSFNGSADVGMFAPSANNLAFATIQVERMRITSAGNVGIGTSSPADKLSLEVGAANQGLSLYFSGVEVGSFRSDAGNATLNANNANLKFATGGSERMRITSTGSVGIGTSSPAYKLQVNGGDATNNNGANTIVATGTNHVRLKVHTPTTGGFRASLVLSSDEAVTATGNEVSISTTGSDEMQFATAGSERARIDASGNVGIGTSSPASQLSVGGNPPTAGAIAAVGASGGIALALSDNVNSSLYVRAAAGGAVIGTDSGGNLRFATDGNTTAEERMRITSTGFVGIGTSSPTSILEIEGSRPYLNIDNTSGVGGDFSGIAFSTAGTTRASIQYDPGNNFLQFNGFDNTERMRITSAGNVGIGTSSPAVQLHATGVGRVSQLQVPNSAGTYTSGSAGFHLFGFSDDNLYFNWFDAGAIVFRNNGSNERMRITSTGRVGIGTTSPDYLFEAEASGGGEGASIAVTNTGADPARLRLNSGHGNWSVSNSVTIADALEFRDESANSTRAMIDSSGNLLVGTTSSAGILTISGDQTYFTTSSTANASLTLRKGAAGADGVDFLQCRDSANNAEFIIQGDGDAQNTNNSYGAISDAKLKENVTDATPKLDKLNQVRVVNYNLIGHERKQIGVIAQELEQIFPSMVQDVIDRDAGGNDLGTTTKSVKYSVFVPMLIKAMQEQQAIIEALEARITALEA